MGSEDDKTKIKRWAMRKLHAWKYRGLTFKDVVLVPTRVQQFRLREKAIIKTITSSY